jgi:ectoine hydroxylase-related dioxygenase (phytanoyl-CoA dioxygenase family)
MFRPWQHPDLVSACTQSGWYHVDQGQSLRGLQCIQGVLTLTDCNESTGGLCLIPKSHLYHDELVDSLPTRVDGNFVPVPAPFHVLKHPQILPRCQAGTVLFWSPLSLFTLCPAGDMIFWDSRLIHCSTHSLSIPSSEGNSHFHTATATTTTSMDFETPLRLAAYISMTPREWASEDTISTRVEAYCRNMTTSHWSHLLTYAIPSHPHLGERKEIQEAKEEVRKLVGLSE